MNESPNIQQIGFSEMYEWQTNPDRYIDRFGLFVQFNKENPNKIEPYNGGEMVGVTTICGSVVSDLGNEWCGKYKIKDNGEYEFEIKTLAVGVKEYDQNLEMPFIRTQKYDVQKKIESEEFDEKLDYQPRICRATWVMVNLIGKCVVYDDGTCESGDYCVPFTSDDKLNFRKLGTAIKYDETKHKGMKKYYVLKRLSKNTIQILYR